MKLRFPVKPTKAGVVWAIVGVLWVCVVGAGLAMLAAFAHSPGVGAWDSPRWPTNTRIPLSRQGATLVLFAHPRCPCTTATVAELERIVAKHPGDVTPWIVFFQPTDGGSDWNETAVWRAATVIPGAHLMRDVGGEEARRFHAATSGQTFLYDPQGDLMFRGGVTFARGHEGDNAGRFAVEACLSSELPKSRQTPVFGCPILTTTEKD